MEKKIETTIMGYIRFGGLGFRVLEDPKLKMKLRYSRGFMA